MNFLDVLIIGFVLLGALHGYQRGLLTSIANFLSGIVAFLVAVGQYKAALRWAEQFLPLQQWLEPVIYRAVLPSVQSKADTLQHKFLENILELLPLELRSYFSSSNLVSVPLPETIEQVSSRLAGALTEHILNLIAFGLVFYTVVLLMQLGFSIILSPFGGRSGLLNSGGGLFFGGLSFIIGLAVLAGLLFPLMNLGVGGSFNVLLQTSYLYPYLLEIFNLLDQLFSAHLQQNLLDPLSLDKGVWF